MGFFAQFVLIFSLNLLILILIKASMEVHTIKIINDSKHLLKALEALAFVEKANDLLSKGGRISFDFASAHNISSHFLYVLFGRTYCANEPSFFLGTWRRIFFEALRNDSAISYVYSVMASVAANRSRVSEETARILDSEKNPDNTDFYTQPYKEFDLRRFQYMESDETVEKLVDETIIKSLKNMGEDIETARLALGRNMLMYPSVAHLRRLKQMLLKLAGEGFLEDVHKGRLLPITVPNCDLNIVRLVDGSYAFLEIPVVSFSMPHRSGDGHVIIDFLELMLNSMFDERRLVNGEYMLTNYHIGNENKKKIDGILKNPLVPLSYDSNIHEDTQSVKISRIDKHQKLIDFRQGYYPSKESQYSLQFLKELLLKKE